MSWRPSSNLSVIASINFLNSKNTSFWDLYCRIPRPDVYMDCLLREGGFACLSPYLPAPEMHCQQLDHCILHKLLIFPPFLAILRHSLSSILLSTSAIFLLALLPNTSLPIFFSTASTLDSFICYLSVPFISAISIHTFSKTQFILFSQSSNLRTLRRTSQKEQIMQSSFSKIMRSFVKNLSQHLHGYLGAIAIFNSEMSLRLLYFWDYLQ